MDENFSFDKSLFLDNIADDLSQKSIENSAYSDELVKSISEMSDKIDKIEGYITRKEVARREVIEKLSKIKKTILAKFMITIGVSAFSAISKSDLTNEDTILNNLITTAASPLDDVPVISDISDYVANSINRVYNQLNNGHITKEEALKRFGTEEVKKDQQEAQLESDNYSNKAINGELTDNDIVSMKENGVSEEYINNLSNINNKSIEQGRSR